MAFLSPFTYTFVNGTTADAGQVMSNLNLLWNGVNSLATLAAQVSVANTFTANQAFTTTGADSVLTIGGANNFNATEKLVANAGFTRAIQSFTGANQRWALNLGNATAEGGANAGSDLTIQNYNDAGALLGTALTIARSTGNVTLANVLIASAGAVGAPAITLGDATSGMYRIGANNNAMAVSGALAFEWNATRLNLAVVLALPAGTVGAPALYLGGDTTSGRYRVGANNPAEAISGAIAFDWNSTRLQMATALDLVLSANGPTSIYSAGYLGVPLGNGGSVITSAYAIVLNDAGKTLRHEEVTARTFTIPANASVAFPIGSSIRISNGPGAGTITLNITTDTLNRGDGTAGTGSRTIAASSVVVITKESATVWTITGVFT